MLVLKICRALSFSRAHFSRRLWVTVISPKRVAPLLSVAAFAITLLYLRWQSSLLRSRDIPPIYGEDDLTSEATAFISRPPFDDTLHGPGWTATPIFTPGTPKPHGSNYTRVLVIPRTSAEDVSWIDEEKLDVSKSIYTVDDPHTELRAPANKGREVMVYLTYIIDHYDTLPDISLFMHAHRWSWHNNELLNNDAAEMIRRLSSEKVIREGFLNLRCHWNPGCPEWMHPGQGDKDANKQEENLMVQCWAELFPGAAAPATLAQPCCAQFAASRARIRAVSLARWRFYRAWLLRTPLNDSLSGRIWEYLWQVVFTGEASVCRDEHECYCDAYGVCFIDTPAYARYFATRARRAEYQAQLDARVSRTQAESGATAGGDTVEEPDPEVGETAALQARLEALDRELEETRQAAVRRGTDAKFRAHIAGRPWRDGDGF